jgi:hypothetical protein
LGDVRLRIWPLALAVVVSLGLLAACGGEDEAEEQDGAASVAETAAAAAPPIATSSPLAPASPSPEPTEAGRMTCVFPQDTQSFRMTITKETGTAEYAYVAPDRWSMVASSDGLEIWSYIEIGTQAWWKEPGSTDWTEGPTSEEFRSYSPNPCASVQDLPISSALAGKKEIVNAIETIHYRLFDDPTRYYVPGAPEGQQAGFFDVWLAVDGNWPVKIVFDVDYNSMDWVWEISDLNDPSIVVEPPTLR